MSKKISVHAKELSKMGASKGGKARAASLSPQQRSKSARKAVLTRWSKKKGVPINLIGRAPNTFPKALNQGNLRIGNLRLKCAVLNDGTRVISFRSFSQYLSTKGGGAYWKKKKEGGEVLPEFVSAGFLAEYIDDDLKGILKNQVRFIATNGKDAEGLEATVIPKICDVWIKALNSGKLDTVNRKESGQRAYQLLSAFANIGIIALIDEATGYQKQKDAYQKLLEQFIAPEIRPWIKTFDDDYYKQLYRLLGWDWDAFRGTKKNHPSYVGKVTNRLIYEKLAPGILDVLKKLNPKNTRGTRKHRFHQDLSSNIGYIKLVKHLSSITTIMEQFEDGEFYEALHKIDSRYPTQKIDANLVFKLPARHKKKK